MDWSDDKMIEILPNAGMLLVGVGAAYVVYRWLFRQKDGSPTAYAQEMEEILNSDKYKVKRRFEE